MTARRDRLRAGAVLLVAAALVYWGCEAITAAAWERPGYSYAHNYISDLGVPGARSLLMGRVIDSPRAWLMNVGFIGHGLLVLAATALLVPALVAGRRMAIVVLAVLHAVGTAMVGVWHGSAWAIAHGQFKYHSIGANLAIFCGNGLAILVGRRRRELGASRAFGRVSVGLGAAGFLSLALLALRTSVPDGIFERGAVYSVFAWEVVVGVAVLLGRSVDRAA